MPNFDDLEKAIKPIGTFKCPNCAETEKKHQDLIEQVKTALLHYRLSGVLSPDDIERLMMLCQLTQ